MGAINDQVCKTYVLSVKINILYRWCLYLRHLSSSAYEVLHNTGVLKLPSQRTLRDYTYFTSTCVGFSTSVDMQLMDAADIANCVEKDKYVLIIFDEMHIKEDLVYDKHSGTLYVIAVCIHY